MGCLKLIHSETPHHLKVVHRSFFSEEKAGADVYRFGFNGMEADNEIAGSENSYTTHFRQLDVRIGRWFSVDPVTKESRSPYEVNSNAPITNKDPRGDDDTGGDDEGGGFSFNVSLNVTLGTNNNGISLSGSATQKFGNWQISVGGSATSYGSFNGTGASSGLELRGSAKGGFDDGNTGFQLGTNVFRGTGDFSEFSQQTGIGSVKFGEFTGSLENDGAPFDGLRLSGGSDSHRTAAVRLGLSSKATGLSEDLSLGFNLFTGARTDFRGDENKVGLGRKYGSLIGDFDEKTPFGYVREKGPQYRVGIAYAGYGKLKLGIDSDRWIRHPIQDYFAHGLLKPQPGFQSLSTDIKPLVQYGGTTGSNSPLFTLYDY